jgi:hypothetical protein
MKSYTINEYAELLGVPEQTVLKRVERMSSSTERKYFVSFPRPDQLMFDPKGRYRWTIEVPEFEVEYLTKLKEYNSK